MKRPKIDTSGTEAAQKATADAQTAANNLQKNFSTDLTTENIPQVVAGGSAAAAGDASVGTSRRRRPGGGLSTQLGINA